MAQALVVGEALVDIMRDSHGGQQSLPGGSPANVALGLARLGSTVALLTSLSGDANGKLVHSHLRQSGVSVLASMPSSGCTATATATIGSSGEAAYSFDIDWIVDPALLGNVPSPRLVHTGSIATHLTPGAEQVLDLFSTFDDRTIKSFDPNIRPMLMDSREAARARVEAFLTASTVVKASEDDLHWLYPGRSAESILEQWLASGPRMVMLTRGADGAIAGTAFGVWAQVRGRRVPVADTIGAGDSFMAAVLHRLLESDPTGGIGDIAQLDVDSLTDLLRYAVHVSSVTVTRKGADLPWRNELQFESDYKEVKDGK